MANEAGSAPVPVGLDGATPKEMTVASRPIAKFVPVGGRRSAGSVPNSPPTRIPRSLRALQLGELARSEGLHAEIHPRLFSAYWVEGRDIGDIDVLVSIAAEAGLDADKAREVLESGALAERVQASTTAANRLGDEEVPVWRADDEVLIVGAQPNDVFADMLGDRGYAAHTET